MILHFMKCDTCDKTHRYEPMMGPAWSQMPHDWLVLMTGDRGEDGRLFCSSDCLRQHFGITEPAQPQEQPQSKMRRFLLFDEKAEEYKGILWESGYVSLDPGQLWPHTNHVQVVYYYSNWNEFKAAHPGCGVQWIDQEAKEEEMSHAAD